MKRRKGERIREYKIAKGWAVFIYISALLIIPLFSWLLIQPLTSGTSWIVIPISIAMITFMLGGIIGTYKSKLIIYEDRIISISAFSKKELKLDEIKGYTVNDNYIVIEPNEEKKKKIRINKYTGGYDELLVWLLQTFTDLEEQIKIEEKQVILDDKQYGLTPDIRERNFQRAHRISKIINWIAGLTAAWILFFPIPYQYSIMVAMIIPIVALIMMKFSNGLIRLNQRQGSVYPSVAYAFILPSCGLLVRATLDYDILDYSNAWPITIIITLSFLTVLLIRQKEITFKKMSDYWTTLSVALFLFAYSFGTVLHLNCYYDDSAAQYFTAKVLNKKTSSGKVTTYYLNLSTWGQQENADKVSVDKDLYDRIEIGDEVNIYLNDGKLGIPWIYVTDE